MSCAGVDIGLKMFVAEGSAVNATRLAGLVNAMAAAAFSNVTHPGRQCPVEARSEFEGRKCM